ncbi:MAG: sugar transferase [Gaiellaceae bacterium]
MRRLLAVADASALTIAFLISELVFRGTRSTGGRYGFGAELTLFALTLPCWIVAAKLYGLYSRDRERADHSTADDAPALLNMVTVGAWLFYGLARFSHLADTSFPKLFAFWAAALVLLVLARVIARHVSRRSLAYVQNTVVVGAGTVGQAIARKLLRHPEYGINMVGFLDDAPRDRRGEVAQLPLLGRPDQLPDIVRAFDVERVIVAFTREPSETMLERVRALTDCEVQVDLVPRLFDVVGPGTDVHSVEGIPLLSLPPLRLSRSSRFLKRMLDAVGASLGLLLLSPLLIAISLAIKLDSPGPMLFRQLRVGAGGRLFRICKFRSMTADADARKHEVAHLNKHLDEGGDPRMFKVPADPRVTRVGRVLRRFSLDELPQLINVVRGEMSLVGPRPLILDEHEHVTDWAQTRLRLRPGITGLWQVLGRSDIPFEEMVKLDYLYVTTWSLWKDVRLIARTLPTLTGSNSGY